MTQKKRRLAYLNSLFPAISHTFILREVERLKSLGFQIPFASINYPEKTPGYNDPSFSQALGNTFYVKKQGFFKAFFALSKRFFTAPITTIKAFAYALSLGGTGLKGILYHFFYLGEAALIGEWMQREGADHLHVHFANPAATAALLTARLYPITFSLTVHGPDEFFDAERLNLKEKFRNAAFICCIGSFCRSQVMKYLESEHWDKIAIVRTGVDPELYSPSTVKQNTTALTLVSIGRLVPAKGFPILLEAFSQLINAGKNLHLDIVGDGPDRKTLEQKCKTLGLKDTVHFHGALDPASTREILRKADLFVLPSFAEGIPVVLMEAMSMEIPCVSTWVNGIPELITHEQEGLLVAPSDIPALAEAILKLCDNPTLRKTLGQNSRKKILHHFNLHHNIDRLAKVFDTKLFRD